MPTIFDEVFGYKTKAPAPPKAPAAPPKLQRTLGDMATMANVQAKYDPAMPQAGGGNAEVVKSPPQQVADQGTGPAMTPQKQWLS
jgi:hypothetical protein